MSLDPMEESDPRRVAEQESVMALVRGRPHLDTFDRRRLADMASRSTLVGAVIAESINNESAAVIEYSLLIRHPAGWEMPATDAERRAMLIEIIIEERRAKRVTVTAAE